MAFHLYVLKLSPLPRLLSLEKNLSWPYLKKKMENIFMLILLVYTVFNYSKLINIINLSNMWNIQCWKQIWRMNNFCKNYFNYLHKTVFERFRYLVNDWFLHVWKYKKWCFDSICFFYECKMHISVVKHFRF